GGVARDERGRPAVLLHLDDGGPARAEEEARRAAAVERERLHRRRLRRAHLRRDEPVVVPDREQLVIDPDGGADVEADAHRTRGEPAVRRPEPEHAVRDRDRLLRDDAHGDRRRGGRRAREDERCHRAGDEPHRFLLRLCAACTRSTLPATLETTAAVRPAFSTPPTARSFEPKKKCAVPPPFSGNVFTAVDSAASTSGGTKAP